METELGDAAIVFEAPGPGSWSIDAVHMSKPWSRLQASVHPPNLAAGFREGTRRYGLLVDTLDYRFVNSLGYFAVAPAPPEQIPERFENAARVFRDKVWREDLDRWEQEAKPAAIRAHRELLAIDPESLSPDELAAYLERCYAHLGRMVEQHHRFSVPAMIPVGDFLAHVSTWTGLPHGEFLALTRGAAPESAGYFPELDRLADAIRANPGARKLVMSDAPPRVVIDALLRVPGELGEAADAYIGIVGHRLLDSLDTGEPSAIEVPEVLVAGIRLAVEAGPPRASAVPDAEVARMRDKVPAEHRAAFDELLGEVRLMSRLRDERGLYSDVWAAGILRRALLVAGARLAEEGRLDDPSHIVEADYPEIVALLNGEGGPTASELARRAEFRRTYRAGQAPAFLGDPPSPPPPLDGLPPDVVRVMHAMGIAIGALFGEPAPDGEEETVRGTGASPGTYTGVARNIDGPADFIRLQRGDVLVTPTTTEAFNIVLPLLGAIVTNSGGVLSHAAIVSREFGIPCVVGTRDATARIKDGTTVTVDGTTGEVRFGSE